MHYIDYLRKDKKFKIIIDAQQPHKLIKRKRICLHWCASAICQQLSTMPSAKVEVDKYKLKRSHLLHYKQARDRVLP